jgi:hypothetical protein
MYLPASFLLLVILCGLWAYWPGLAGPFLFDDFANLPALGDYGGIRNWDTLKLFVFGNGSGPGGRPVAMVSFLLNDVAWPSDPFAFKYTNLLLHLLSGLLLCWLIYRILRLREPEGRDVSAAWIAVLAAAIWLVHPFHVSTTLYIVQRMAILCALFSVLGLLLYVHGRTLMAARPRHAYLWMTLGVAVFTPLATLSKENGVLLPLLILVTEYTALRPPGRATAPSRWWTLVFLGLPTALLASYVIWNWSGWLDGYRERPFTLSERLFTEGRIVFGYLRDLLLPRLNTHGLFNEGLDLSRGLLDPPTTLAALLLIGLLIVGAWLLRRRYSLLSLAVLFFFAGHLLESTFVPLEISFEHRNYLPSIFLFLPVAHGVVAHAGRFPRLMPASAALLLTVLATMTLQQTRLWGDQSQLILAWARQNPLSIRAQRSAAIEWERLQRPDLALRHLDNVRQRFPDNIELILHSTILRCRYEEATLSDQSELEAALRSGFYDFRTYSLLETLINSVVSNACPGVGFSGAHRLLDALLSNSAARSAGGPQRQIYHLQGILFTAQQLPGPALASFRKSQGARADVGAGLLQVGLLASHGMLAEAWRNRLPPPQPP